MAIKLINFVGVRDELQVIDPAESVLVVSLPEKRKGITALLRDVFERNIQHE